MFYSRDNQVGRITKSVGQTSDHHDRGLKECDPETERRSTVWLLQNVLTPTEVKLARNGGRILTASFFLTGHLESVPLRNQRSTNGDYGEWYVTKCMPEGCIYCCGWRVTGRRPLWAAETVSPRCCARALHTENKGVCGQHTCQTYRSSQSRFAITGSYFVLLNKTSIQDKTVFVTCCTLNDGRRGI
ncbi:hypothetical protein EVAR_14758_1 [Eumeta japonica]|uniref:Uncharacterized protein n=1 Tax=Eumeta variegata TaxID=151549 RepID=A0A4C1TWD2_EUMVA|nr:hypothetical protein EVAR_14758_1 [Eumeta japonica]